MEDFERKPWRFHPAKGLRAKGEPYYHTIQSEELDEEMFETREEFLDAIRDLMETILTIEDEGNENGESD